MAIGDLHGEWWVAVAQFDTGPFLMYVGSWQGAQVQGNLYRIRIRDVGRRVRGEAWGGLHKNATLWGLRRDIVLRLHRGSWEWRRIPSYTLSYPIILYLMGSNHTFNIIAVISLLPRKDRKLVIGRDGHLNQSEASQGEKLEYSSEPLKKTSC